MLPKETNQRMKDKKKNMKLVPIESESESESDTETDDDAENGDEINETEEIKLKREKPKSLRQKETPEEKKLRKQQVHIPKLPSFPDDLLIFKGEGIEKREAGYKERIEVCFQRRAGQSWANRWSFPRY